MIIIKDKNMSNFHDLLISRRSIRKYTDEAISPEAVKQILEAALISPTSKNCTCWEFIVVEGEEELKRLSQCKEHGAKPIAGAKLAIIVMADTTKSDVWIEDASIASTIIQLQAQDLGLGSCWIQLRGRYRADGVSAQEFISEIYGVPEHIAVEAVISIGHKDEERKPYNPEKCKWEKVHIGKW